MIFRGTFEHALDAKHRLTVPSRYRAAFAGGVALVLGPPTQRGSDAKSLSIWPSEEYDSFAQAALRGINPLLPTAQELRRLLYGNSWELELDSANRLMIPPPALAFAGLTKDVVISGAGQCLEIWDRAVHSQYNEAALARYPEIVESLDHKIVESFGHTG